MDTYTASIEIASALSALEAAEALLALRVALKAGEETIVSSARALGAAEAVMAEALGYEDVWSLNRAFHGESLDLSVRIREGLAYRAGCYR